LLTGARAEMLAYWSFGPSGTLYTEVPDINRTAGEPSFTLTPRGLSTKDPNGKNGTSYTDPDGMSHSAGQCAAWEEAWDDAGDWEIELDASGYRLTSLRFDAYTDEAGINMGPLSFRVSYRVGVGEYVPLASGVPFQTNGFHEYTYDLSGVPALRDVSSVFLRVDELVGGTKGSCGFDNVLVQGTAWGPPRPVIALTPAKTDYYLRPDDSAAFNVLASSSVGGTLNLSARGLPAGAIFTNVAGSVSVASSFQWTSGTSGTHTVWFDAANSNGTTTVAVALHVMTTYGSMVLNEANAVDSKNQIETPDPWFGAVDGNGGNWMELVVLQDHLDVRGWRIQWARARKAAAVPRNIWVGDAVCAQGELIFSQHANLSNLRAGSILTLIEQQHTSASGVVSFSDLSIDPSTNDWWMNLCTVEEAGRAGRYMTTDSNDDDSPGSFSVGSDDWRARIVNAEGILVAPLVGEGVNGCDCSVSSEEVLALDADFSTSMTTAEDYDDRKYSSFSELNTDKDSLVQEATWMRVWHVFTNAQQVMLNEANFVAEGQFLGGGTFAGNNDQDELFGRIAGNGGPWMEWLVLADHLDMRGWKMEWQNAGATTNASGTLTFSTNSLWSDLRRGTAITIAQNVCLTNDGGGVVFAGSDASYAPCMGNDWIHISTLHEATQANPLVVARFHDTTNLLGRFQMDSANWEATILDAEGRPRFGPVGEAYMEKSVSSNEVIRYAGDPSNVSPYVYTDADDSSFGLPNEQEDAADQDWQALRAGVEKPAMVLNEYNVVAGGELLKNDGEDTWFGRRKGNGGNWMEWLVLADHLDVRGWRVQWAELDGTTPTDRLVIWYPDGTVKQGELLLGQNMYLADLRKGTLMTFCEESVATNGSNLRFDPIEERWQINICSVEEAGKSTPLVVTRSNVPNVDPGYYAVGHENWIVQLLDAQSNVVFGPFGESMTPTMSLSSDEVARREADDDYVSWICWDDASSSTYASENSWGTQTQDFSSVRTWFPSADPADLDDDALPDDWEGEELGGTWGQPQVDEDEDTFSNLEEYIALTSPTNPAAYLETALAPSETPTLRFFGKAGRQYSIEVNEHLGVSPWTTWTNGLEGGDAWTNVPLPLDWSAPAFRIKAEIHGEGNDS